MFSYLLPEQKELSCVLCSMAASSIKKRDILYLFGYFYLYYTIVSQPALNALNPAISLQKQKKHKE